MNPGTSTTLSDRGFFFTMEYTFPQYRSLEGFNRHYMITDERTFYEAVHLSGEWKITEVKAVQYPEILRIKDMLECNFTYRIAEHEIARLFESSL